jgi:serine/threonine protein kinase/dipeptidyl aminopeptidase/acylaminoacyl peptidase
MPPDSGNHAARFKQVEALFEAAQQRPAAQRTEFLRQACADDPELRAEVESLLKADSGSHLIDGSPLSSIAERAPALKPGDKLGNFEIVAMIGRGGMGEVYRARDPRLKREVAIKTLPPGLSADRDRITRFEREGRAASALNHPNIVSVFDIGTERGLSFIVSELVDGETLARAIQRGPLPLRKLIEVSTQICDGLAAAHAAGVIHRDLKPGNIMLTRDGRVKILDFGLARQNHAPGIESTTMEASHPGMIMGTPGYMSPEQVRGETTDARSDLFSLGVIIYEMASGQRAFRGSSSIEMMNAILKDDPPELPTAWPRALDRIVRRCLEKEPARRFQSAADLGFAINTLAVATGNADAPRRRSWLKWAISGGLASAVVFIVVWLQLRPTQTGAPAEVSLRRLTDDSGYTIDASLSADGKFVTYSKPQNGIFNRNIWVQQVDGTGSAVRITEGPDNNIGPQFSPDGTQVVFVSTRNGGGIYVVPALGGEARELAHGEIGPQFSPDGRWLLSYTDYGAFVRRVAGGAPEQVFKDFRPCGSTVWSPDSSRLFLVKNCSAPVTPWVYNVDSKVSTPSRIFGPADVGTLVWKWLPNPSRLIISKRIADAFIVSALPVSADGTRATGSPQKLTSVTDHLAAVSAAPDGRIVLSVWTSMGRVWCLPIDPAGRPIGSLKRITDGADGESAMALSRDGTKLAFTSQRPDGYKLFFKDLTTGHQKELLTVEGPTTTGTGVFNSDGSGLIVSHNNLVEHVPLTGGLPKKVWEGAGVNLWDLSPDGKSLLFFEPYPENRGGVARILRLDSSSQSRFLDDPELDAWQLHFSHDGRWVVFNATPRPPDQKWPPEVPLKSSRIYIALFRESVVPRSEWIPITEGEWDDKPRFSPDGKSIIFMTGRADEDGSHRLWSQRLKADMRPDGKPVALYSPPDSLGVLMPEDIWVGPGLVTFTQDDMTGSLWLLEPAKVGAK